MVDPSGNFSIGELRATLRTVSTLATNAIARTKSFFSRALNSSSRAISAGVNRILVSSPQFLKSIAKRCRSNARRGRVNICGFAKGFVQAEAKIELKLRIMSSSRIQPGARNRVFVIVGAFDAARGRGTAAVNGKPVRVSPALSQHARGRLGLGIGDKHQCGKVVGRCAEWRSANNLLRTGSKIKSLRWTRAYFVDEHDTDPARVQRGGIAPYCAVCREGLGLTNFGRD